MIAGLLQGWRRLGGLPQPDPNGDQVGASAARLHSEHVLEQENDMLVTTTAIAYSMREMRERNHFAELIVETMRK